MKINGLINKIITFKKRKEMDDFNRNLIIDDILKGFSYILMGFVCSSEGVLYQFNCVLWFLYMSQSCVFRCRILSTVESMTNSMWPGNMYLSPLWASVAVPYKVVLHLPIRCLILFPFLFQG